MTDENQLAELLERSLSTVTADTEAVIHRALAHERRRRVHLRMTAGSVALALAVAAALVAVVLPAHHNASSDTITVSPSPSASVTQQTPPAAVVTGVALPSSWFVLNVLTGPLPTGDSSRVTERDYRYTDASGPGSRDEIEVDLSTGDVANDLAETQAGDPSEEHYIALRRPGASRVLYNDAGGELRSWSWMENGAFVQVIARGATAPDIPFITGLQLSVGAAPPFIRITVPAGPGGTPTSLPSNPSQPLDAADIDTLRTAFHVPASATVYSAERTITGASQTVVFRYGQSQVIVSTQVLDSPIPLGATVDPRATHSLTEDAAGDAFATSNSGNQVIVSAANRYGQYVRIDATSAAPASTYLAAARAYLNVDDPAAGLM